MRPGVAAGHPATAAAGAEILRAGGNAADAAIAGTLASCVAETLMTGLLGGGHAIYWDAAERTALNLDCFCTVPSGEGGGLTELQVPVGEELVHYAIAPGPVAVPGVPTGLRALHDRFGSFPWKELCEPALRLARDGVPLTPAHAACLAMLAPVMTMDVGARIYAPGGMLLRAGEPLEQPGLVNTMTVLADEGPGSVYEGSLAQAVLELMRDRGGIVTESDLATYEALWAEPVTLEFAGFAVLTRGGLSGLPELLARMPRLADLDETGRVLEVL